MDEDQLDLVALALLIGAGVITLLEHALGLPFPTVLKLFVGAASLTFGIFRWVKLRPFVQHFAPTDWVRIEDEGFQILVPNSRHRKGKQPSVVVSITAKTGALLNAL